MTSVIDITEVDQAGPLLADLRSSLSAKVFHSRLNAAISGGYRMLGLVAGDAVIGLLGYRIVQDICWGKSFYIDDLNVAPGLRGTGHGTTLLDAAKLRAQEEGCDHLRLCSGLRRTDTHRFYEAHDLKSVSKQFVLALKGD